MINVENLLRHYPRPYLSDIEVKNLIGGTANSRYSKVKRMIAQGKLIHIRRGLYVITDEINTRQPHPFELAQYLYGPSLISLESALSYHQLIPEAVFTITNVTGKRSKEFHTPLGNFSYQSVPFDNLYIETRLVNENQHSFFIAKPWRAICDYIYCHRINWKNLDPLINNLRIDINNLPKLEENTVFLLDKYYHHRRINLFLKNIYRELGREVTCLSK
jgi:hypothetical protein